MKFDLIESVNIPQKEELNLALLEKSLSLYQVGKLVSCLCHPLGLIRGDYRKLSILNPGIITERKVPMFMVDLLRLLSKRAQSRFEESVSL